MIFNGHWNFTLCIHTSHLTYSMNRTTDWPDTIYDQSFTQLRSVVTQAKTSVQQWPRVVTCGNALSPTNVINNDDLQHCPIYICVSDRAIQTKHQQETHISSTSYLPQVPLRWLVSASPRLSPQSPLSSQLIYHLLELYMQLTQTDCFTKTNNRNTCWNYSRFSSRTSSLIVLLRIKNIWCYFKMCCL